MSKPGLVSVLLPNRNHAHYLPRALDAMLAQTWSNLEIIVIDDASSDDSRHIVEGYARRDPRVRLLALAEHHGINRAVDAGLAAAAGEFVYGAGADDFVESIFLERCVGALTKYPQAGLCFSDPTEFHEQGERALHFPLYLSDQPVFFDPAALAALFSRNFFHISANTGIYRLDAFRLAGGYRAQLHWLSDWFVTLVVALRYGACYLPQQLTYVTIRGDSYSARNRHDPAAQHRLLDQVLDLLAQPAYADIAPTMRASGLIPEYHLRTLLWLIESREGRRFISARLVTRILARAAWSFLRPVMPTQWRRTLRKTISQRKRAA
jgi:glycosyltransferase involved in cell wall biosynthesis